MDEKNFRCTFFQAAAEVVKFKEKSLFAAFAVDKDHLNFEIS